MQTAIIIPFVFTAIEELNSSSVAVFATVEFDWSGANSVNLKGLGSVGNGVWPPGGRNGRLREALGTLGAGGGAMGGQAEAKKKGSIRVLLPY